MPFITEEIWNRLPDTEGSIMTADYPEYSGFMHDESALTEMDVIMGVVNGVRNIRGEMNIHPSKKVDIHIEMPEDSNRKTIASNMEYIKNLARVDSIIAEEKLTKPDASVTAVFDDNQVHILLKGIIDFNEEKIRLKKEIKKVKKEMEGSEKKLSNKGFLEKAPDEIIEKVRGKVDTLKAKLEKLEGNLSFFEEIDD
jgi:valyl-tRNA synthetase